MGLVDGNYPVQDLIEALYTITLKISSHDKHYMFTNLHLMFFADLFTFLAHNATELFRFIALECGTVIDGATDDATDLCIDHFLGCVALAFYHLQHR